MAKELRKILCNKGFTLVEVMISLAIFAVFASAYLTAQGYNISDSTVMREELELKRYAELKINELMVTPPELKDSLTLTKEAGKFEENDNFSFSIEYKKFIVPDINKITGADAEAQDPTEAKIFENIKKNLEKIIWQVEVTVKNETSERVYSISTWLYNQQAQVMFEQL